MGGGNGIASAPHPMMEVERQHGHRDLPKPKDDVLELVTVLRFGHLAAPSVTIDLSPPITHGGGSVRLRLILGDYF